MSGNAEQIVKAKFPDAHCWIVMAYPELWEVMPADGYHWDSIGDGSTELAAWKAAASYVNSITEPRP